MKIRPKFPDGELLTARQWAKKGYIVNPCEQGEQMWTNCYCGDKAYYFTSLQVHKGTEDEVHQFFEPERQRRRDYERLRRERLREEKRIEFELQQRKILLKEALTVPQIDVKNPSGIVCFDVETTGLNDYEDEILQFSAIDGDGNVLLDTLVRPYVNKKWPDAQRIHGISPQDVEAAPQFHSLIPIIQGIFNSAKLLVSYNGDFDMGFLSMSGINVYDIKHYDVILAFAEIYGEWSTYHGDYKWQKLTTCAAYYGYDFKAHDSLEDVRATLFCYKKIIERKRDKDNI